MKITKRQNTSVLPILQSGQGFVWTPEGLKSEELATWEDVPEDIKQLAKDINDREYEEHRKNNDVRFTGEKALEPEDWKFATALAGGVGTAQAASTMGWVPAIATEAGSAVLGTAGSYGGNKLGTFIDNKYGTNLTPYLTIFGGLAGGLAGGIGSYKGLVNYGTNGKLVRGALGEKFKDSTLIWGDEFRNAVDEATINKAIKTGKLRRGDADSYVAYHQSDAPITEFKFPFNERWDVAHHGADPNSAFFTVDNPANSGFLSKRPYIGEFKVTLQKPMIQTGEIHGMTKNGIRNKIVQLARQEGADGILFDGIADNQLYNQKVLQAFENANIEHQRTMKSPQIMWMGPTTGKTTYSKINNNIVDIDPLTKPIRKEIAAKLGLDFRDPKVSESPKYQEAVVKMINDWLKDPVNRDKTMVASTKFLLDPKHGIKFANEPFMPDFETFVMRNQSRGFRETPEQLRTWYNNILAIKPDMKISNTFASDLKYKKGGQLPKFQLGD